MRVQTQIMSNDSISTPIRGKQRRHHANSGPKQKLTLFIVCLHDESVLVQPESSEIRAARLVALIFGGAGARSGPQANLINSIFFFSFL